MHDVEIVLAEDFPPTYLTSIEFFRSRKVNEVFVVSVDGNGVGGSFDVLSPFLACDCYGYAPGMSTADLFRIYILSAYVFRSFPKHIRRLPLFSASSFFLIMVSVPYRLYCLIVLLSFTINLQFTSIL